ncbi:ABC transporter permease [Bifidobacterium sp. ESL0690]|uniref:ABC transporter permease n=1 Tax=Bifidobacterium sp. ESL0690 TaxID=2983214 RepID=UPI0023F8760E|nr:ABC transporter permease [Bifidobacterium sp. ESL0690]WEV46876.1 ABC transporter permease [Bifidobacterium sp. ESL0690]
MKSKFKMPQELGVLIVVLLVAVLMGILSPEFRTASNLQVLLLNGSVVTFLALGQACVLLTGGIDLSVGSNIALTGMIAALAMRAGIPWWIAALLAILTGIVVGLFNGAVIHYGHMPPFIVTFATFGISASIPKILTQAKSVTVSDPMFAFFGRGTIFGIPMPIIMVIIAAVIIGVVLNNTATGVHVYAVGGNADTARLAGINIARTTIFVYVISGICAGFGGVITASRLMVGYPTAGSGNEQFYSIASAVVGGVSLFGGVGTILGAFIGSLLIAEVSNGMNVIGVDSYWQPLVIGVIILVGVLFDTNKSRISFGKKKHLDATADLVAKAAETDGGKEPKK